MIVPKKNGEFDLEPIKNRFKLLKDGDYFVEISKNKRSRSLQQNRYYSGFVVKTLSDELGYTTHEMRLLLREQFLGYKDYEINGKKITELISTSDLKVNEMEEFLQNVRGWAFDFAQILIPQPNEPTYE